MEREPGGLAGSARGAEPIGARSAHGGESPREPGGLAGSARGPSPSEREARTGANLQGNQEALRARLAGPSPSEREARTGANLQRSRAMKIGIFAPLANPFATPDYSEHAGAGRGGTRLPLDLGGRARGAVRRLRLAVPVRGRRPDPGRRARAGMHRSLPRARRSWRRGRSASDSAPASAWCRSATRSTPPRRSAAIDWLSNGRFDFGVGIGWLKEEFRRARRAVRATRRADARLPEGDAAPVDRSDLQYGGEFYSLAPCRQYPKPIQQPHPPIHFGGESDAALKRVADLGQGWFGFSIDPDATRRAPGASRPAARGARPPARGHPGQHQPVHEADRPRCGEALPRRRRRPGHLPGRRHEPRRPAAGAGQLAKTIVEPAGKL